MRFWRRTGFSDRDTTLPAFADENGRVHPEFNQLGATSGRLSCSAPNVQQIPKHSELGKKLRKMFVAEDVRLLMVETMQTAPEGFVVPMVVEAKIAANWGDAK